MSPERAAQQEPRTHFVYPYAPGSEPAVKSAMLREIGIDSVAEVYHEIPDHLRFRRRLNVPGPIPSEYALRRYVEGLLAQNRNCHDNLSFQ